MRQAATTLQIDTRGRGFYSIGPAAESFAQGQGMRTGLLTLFCRHTSASLLIQENADPSVLSDLENFLARIAPEDPTLYAHDSEGAGRHARAYSRGADADASFDTDHRRRAHARRLAGRVSRRAPAPAASPRDRAACDRRLSDASPCAILERAGAAAGNRPASLMRDNQNVSVPWLDRAVARNARSVSWRQSRAVRMRRRSNTGWAVGVIAPWCLSVGVLVSFTASAGQDAVGRLERGALDDPRLVRARRAVARLGAVRESRMARIARQWNWRG